jgi:hypothetical protein
MPPRRRRRRDRLAHVTHALNHPLRLRILEMHKRMKSRPLSVETMVTVLGQTREYKEVTAAHVRYHRQRLLDAKLLPEG